MCGNFGVSSSSSSSSSVFPAVEGWQRSCSDLVVSEKAVGWGLVGEEEEEEEERGEDGGGGGGGKEHGGAGASACASGTGADDGGGSNSGASGGVVRVQHPIACVSHKDGVYRCAFDDHPNPTTATTTTTTEVVDAVDDAKVATTLVRKLSFNGKTSLVEVKPVHGRTHQIRLHLQWLGHPIANDPCYGGQLHYGTCTATVIVADHEFEV